MIVIVSAANDLHSLCVKHELESRGEEVFIADSTALARGVRISFGLDPSDVCWTNPGGETIRISDASCIWLRRMYPASAPEDVTLGEERLYIRREWNQLMLGVFDSLATRVIDRPKTFASVTKPRQLVVAKTLGLTIPRTIISNCRESAIGFVDSTPSAIHKPLSGRLDVLLPTKRWDDNDRDVLDYLVIAPTIFQEMVEAEVEVRVTVIGHQAFAAEFRHETVDGRLDLHARCKPHTLPPDVERKVIGIVEAFGLSFGTMDLLLKSDGEYVFLELNTQGQFLWVEVQTKMPLIASLATLLAEGSS